MTHAKDAFYHRRELRHRSGDSARRRWVGLERGAVRALCRQAGGTGGRACDAPGGELSAKIAELSLAEATAIFFIAPILITIFAMFFLQEKVGIRRGLACFIGFLGMLFIIKPGTISFELISIFPLIAALFYTALHIITRKYGSQEKPLTMGFYIQVCFLVTSLMFAGGFYLADFDAEHSNALTFLTGSWVSVSTFDMFHILVGIALPISIGGILVSYAYKNYEASFLAPFEYGALVIAVVSTYLIWNEIPDRLSLIGMILIMLSGIFVSLREKQVSSIRSSRKIIHRR